MILKLENKDQVYARDLLRIMGGLYLSLIQVAEEERDAAIGVY